VTANPAALRADMGTSGIGRVGLFGLGALRLQDEEAAQAAQIAGGNARELFGL